MAKTKEVIYHYTCTYHLAAIEKSGYLMRTDSNFAIGKPHAPVLWLTTSPTPENNGLLFDSNIPECFNKTLVRVTLRKHDFMVNWAEWHKRTGRNEAEKEMLIESAGAEETHKNWYISLIDIPLGEVLLIENLKTGRIYYEKPKEKKNKTNT